MNFEKPATEEHRRTVLLGLLLVIVTLGLYWPATTHGFIQFDDGMYITENPAVNGGLSLAGLKWAFTSTHASNWHPLTWISHMLDCSIYGLFPGGHHLTNIVLHAANTLLLFLVLKKLTKSLWPGWMVAALFGWHPLHVESVAWVAERKDVLSTLFMLLTLGAYGRYVNEIRVQGSRFKAWYFWALLFFALGLMSKPMLVTLPCILLLLDYWPLRRIAYSAAGKAASGARESWPKLIREKLPFFGLAFAACVVTMIAQRHGGAIRSVADVPLGFRALNAFTAYALYAGKTVCPVNLCIYYLLPAQTPLFPAVGAVLALAGVTGLALRWRSQYPWLVVGWLWFLGALVPVIGLVQVGSQAMADRYTYIPCIGLFIAAVWSVDHALAHGRAARVLRSGLAVSCLLVCLALTRHQLAFWHDDIALFQRAVSVTRDNYFAEFELGKALATADRTVDAIEHYTTALRINPQYEPAHYQLGIELTGVGRLDEAAFHFSEALKRDPTSEELHNDLGVVFAQQGKLDAAIGEFRQAIQFSPGNSKPYLNYANALQTIGQTGPALTNYARARELDPRSPEVLDKLALLLATCADTQWRNPAEAVKLAEQANELTQQQSPDYLSTLATAYAATGNYPKAIASAELARDRAQEQKLPNLVKKLEGELEAYRRGQNPPANPN